MPAQPGGRTQMARFLTLLFALLGLFAQPAFAGCSDTERELRITLEATMADVHCIPQSDLGDMVRYLEAFQVGFRSGIPTVVESIEPVGPKFPFLEAEVCDLLEADVLPLIKEGWALAPDCSDLDESLAEMKKLRKDVEGRRLACIGFENFFKNFYKEQHNYYPLVGVVETANFLRCGPDKG